VSGGRVAFSDFSILREKKMEELYECCGGSMERRRRGRVLQKKICLRLKQN